LPAEGGVLVCSNHQSFFDPVLVGISFKPQLGYLARKTLFRFFLFGWIIRYLDAIPIDRSGMGVGGVKEMLRRLRREEIVHIFPEGTRSKDGALQTLQPGFLALARRGRCQILPMAVSGAFDAWPRSAKFPRLATLSSEVGPAISAAAIQEMSDEQLIAEVEYRIRVCLAAIQERKTV